MDMDYTVQMQRMHFNPIGTLQKRQAQTLYKG